MPLEDNLEKTCRAQLKKLRLPKEFMQVVEQIYIPLSNLLVNKLTDQTIMISINGAQGTGKSTLTNFLKIILEEKLKQPVAAFSIDDFYKTYGERQKLSKMVHPLLCTRGVPGTHDIQLMEQSISDLLEHRATLVPQFNKATDDRAARQHWLKIDKPVKVILFEGWCNHSPTQTEEELKEPINELEAEEDKDGTWRHYANSQLEEYHRRIFSLADSCIMLKSPDFKKVYEWRSLQEDKLRESISPELAHRVMDEKTLKRFIQHYERITRHTLRILPEKADIVLPVNDDHGITGIINRHA